MTWVRFLGYAAFSALGRVYQVVILDKILSDFSWSLSLFLLNLSIACSY
jgi:hypothetical protein